MPRKTLFETVCDLMTDYSCALLSTSSPTSPNINVTIINNQSLDVTAAFQTRVWVQPKIVALPGLTGRQVGGVRLVNKCRSATAQFRYSHCDHEDGVAGSMQRYITYCREEPESIDDDGPYRIWREPPVLGEAGSCENGEVCINGLRTQIGDNSVARCIKQDGFKVIHGDRGDSPVGLANLRASMVLSRYDGETPEKVDSMAYAESGPVDPALMATFGGINKTCEDCFELVTQKSAPKTENLKIEASLMTAGALGGILWVALSG